MSIQFSSLLRPVIILGIALATSRALPAQWLQHRFNDARHGFNPLETILSRSNAGQLQQKWTFPTPQGRVVSSAIVVQGVVYFASGDGFVYAVNAVTGEQVWRSPQINAGASTPAFAYGRLYVGTGVDSGHMYSLSATTGQVLWRTNVGGVSSSPTVSGDKVYVGTNDDKVVALNAFTGSVAWEVPTDNSISASPALANGVLYVGSNFGTFYAINAETGSIVWQKGIVFPTPIFSTAAVANGLVYVGATDEFTYALSAATGEIVWRRFTPFQVTAPAVAGGAVFVGTNNHKLFALNGLTGAIIWRTDLSDIVQSDPTIANGVLYVGAGWNIFVVDATNGTILKKFETNFPVTASPAVVNGMVYVGSHDRRLYAFGL